MPDQGTQTTPSLLATPVPPDSDASISQVSLPISQFTVASSSKPHALASWVFQPESSWCEDTLHRKWHEGIAGDICNDLSAKWGKWPTEKALQDFVASRTQKYSNDHFSVTFVSAERLDPVLWAGDWDRHDGTASFKIESLDSGPPPSRTARAKLRDWVTPGRSAK